MRCKHLRNVGTFHVTDEMMVSTQGVQLVRKAMAGMIVIECRDKFEYFATEYLADSRHFERNEEGMIAPRYELTFDGNKPVFTKMEYRNADR